MASSLIERLLYQVEPSITTPFFTSVLTLISSDVITINQAKTILDLDTDSGAELVELVATMPGITLLNLTLTNVANRARWPAKVGAIISMQGILYGDAEGLRSMLGI